MRASRFCMWVLALFVSLPIQAAQPAATPGSNPDAGITIPQEQYGGLVANQTVTVAGQDFYQYFVSAWRDQALNERYAIAIHERPSARSGSRIWIEYAQRPIFQAVLPASRAAVKALSEQAVTITYQKVADTEVERLLFRDVDLGVDEI